MMLRCFQCSRHVKSSSSACPFCGARVLSGPRARGKSALALAAGVAAMGVGLGCAYGMPPDDYNRDASKPDVSVNDGSKDAPADVKLDAPGDADGGLDATGDATLDADAAGG